MLLKGLEPLGQGGSRAALSGRLAPLPSTRTTVHVTSSYAPPPLAHQETNTAQSLRGGPAYLLATRALLVNELGCRVHYFGTVLLL